MLYSVQYHNSLRLLINSILFQNLQQRHSHTNLDAEVEVDDKPANDANEEEHLSNSESDSDISDIEVRM